MINPIIYGLLFGAVGRAVESGIPVSEDFYKSYNQFLDKMLELDSDIGTIDAKTPFKTIRGIGNILKRGFNLQKKPLNTNNEDGGLVPERDPMIEWIMNTLKTDVISKDYVVSRILPWPHLGPIALKETKFTNASTSYDCMIWEILPQTHFREAVAPYTEHNYRDLMPPDDEDNKYYRSDFNLDKCYYVVFHKAGSDKGEDKIDAFLAGIYKHKETGEIYSELESSRKKSYLSKGPRYSDMHDRLLLQARHYFYKTNNSMNNTKGMIFSAHLSKNTPFKYQLQNRWAWTDEGHEESGGFLYKGPLLNFEEEWLLYLKGRQSRVVLLQGPPGCGKTTFLCDFCYKHFKSTMIFSPDSLPTPVKSEGPSSEPNDFTKKIKFLGPEVVVLDDFDRLPDQEAMSSHYLNLLEEISDVVPLVFLTTNDFTKLPTALLRAGRISQIINIPYPSPDELYEVLKLKLNMYIQSGSNFPALPTDEKGIEDIKSLFKGQTGAYVEELIDRAKVVGWELHKLRPDHDITHLSHKISFDQAKVNKHLESLAVEEL